MIDLRVDDASYHLIFPTATCNVALGLPIEGINLWGLNRPLFFCIAIMRNGHWIKWYAIRTTYRMKHAILALLFLTACAKQPQPSIQFYAANVAQVGNDALIQMR